MPTCRDVADRATDYMERRLSVAERVRVAMHLLMCSVCRLYVRQLTVTRDVLRRLPRPLPSDEELDRMLHVFRCASGNSDGRMR
jgi:hypothetical protein